MAPRPDHPIVQGPLTLDPSGGTLRLTYQDVEIVRQIDCPIRDADWRTTPVIDVSSHTEATSTACTLERQFRTEDDALSGSLVVVAEARADAATVTLDLTLTALRDTRVNRAGFIILHPAWLAGNALSVDHPDGTTEETSFPIRISPGQPVFDIKALRYRTHGLDVAITATGEVFEMEDQRNWTDASYKTYCRPLARPRPFSIGAGETIRQSLSITVTGTASSPPAAAQTATGTMPAITLAHEAVLADRPAPTGLADLGAAGLLLRVDARAPDLTRPIDAPVTLEIVADTPADIAAVAALCAGAGLAPARVIALPRAYLASHQPEGPWPSPRPVDFLPAVRAAFPDAEAGGGVLTNFTEFNRHPPDPAAIDFATFGTTAIVHAADDRSVRETLEALPSVFASARALAPDRPLHLGLVAIAMRSNPYGSATAPNPDARRIAMASDDPRQRTSFAAAFAIGAVAEAARAGIASLALAMAAGPLAPGDAETRFPLFDAIAALAALAGQTVDIEGGPGGLLILRTETRTIAANLGPDPVSFNGRPLASMDVAL